MKPWFHRVLRLFLFLLTLLWLVPAALAEPEAVTAARQSVVRIYGAGTDSETGASLRWTGSGIAVGTAGENTDVFLTNWHVATGNGQCRSESVQLWILRDGAAFDADRKPLAQCAVPCRVLCATEGEPDIAVLQAEEWIEDFPALPLGASCQVPQGTAVYALGFPETTALASAAPEDVTVTQGQVQQQLAMAAAGNTRCLIHSAPIAPGFSGGPLINEQGEVVGINSYGFGAAEHASLFCAISIEEAADLLAGLEILHPPVTPDNS